MMSSGKDWLTRRGRLARLVLLFALVGAGNVVPPPRTARAAPEVCFVETNACLSGAFLDYWTAHGGLAINGYPLADPRREVLEDDQEYLVQYLERVRLELHPENPPPYDVLLGQFGRQILRDRMYVDSAYYEPFAAPSAPRDDAALFPETGHNLGGRFLSYWRANGGLAQFGYPLTEEFPAAEPNLPKGLIIQYFERARFEYHPENAGTPSEILLGQFGRSIREAVATRAGITGPFAALYRARPELAARLGAPTVDADYNLDLYTRTGSVLAFEHGLMLYDGQAFIQVLCGESERGESLAQSQGFQSFQNPWNPSMPAGGGPGPRPGTYEPKYGFGLLWQQFRDCLGYATSPDETYYTQTHQWFGTGMIFSLPDRTNVYVLDNSAYVSKARPGRYQRYALP